MPRSMPAHFGRAKALAVAALQALLLAGCAHAGGQAGNWDVPPPPPPPPAHDHVQPVLSELPQDGPPGECYARVMVPGQPVVGPPQAQGAAWILNPGPPGSPGPIWCLVPTGPAPVAMMITPEREGWIRVLCDVDATPARVEGWQKRLHKEGYYEGAPTGRYDPATAEAVGRFQNERRIRHGGYLSTDTVEALEGPLPPPPPRVHAQARVHAPARPPVAVASAGHGRAYASSSAAASAGGVGYAPYAAVAQQPAYGYPSYPSYPAYPQAYPAYPQTQAYPQAGYVQQGYSARSGASYQSQSSYASSSHGGYGYGYAAPQEMVQGYAQAYAPPPPLPYPYGQAYGQGYGQSGYSQSYGYGQSYGYAQGYEAYGPRPAYAAPRSAIQGGWLTWDGKPRF